MELKVTLSVAGGTEDGEAVLNFYSSPIVAGKFTGAFQERMENGSLLVDAGVSVQKRMMCFVSANLYSADKEVPTHHAERRMIVDPSMKTITFTFFGKIFRDSAYEGAFRVQDLKGQCENFPFAPELFMDTLSHKAELEALPSLTSVAEPGRIYLEYTNLTYQTKRYANSDFSDQEWQSPARTQKLQMLEKAAQQPLDPATLSALKRLAQ